MIIKGRIWISVRGGIIGWHGRRGDIKLKAPWAPALYSERNAAVWRRQFLGFRLFRTPSTML